MLLFFCYFSPYTAQSLFTPTSTLYVYPIIHCTQFFFHTFFILWNMKYTCFAVKCSIQCMHCCESCVHVCLDCFLQSISLSKYSQPNYCPTFHSLCAWNTSNTRALFIDVLWGIWTYLTVKYSIWCVVCGLWFVMKVHIYRRLCYFLQYMSVSSYAEVCMSNVFSTIVCHCLMMWCHGEAICIYLDWESPSQFKMLTHVCTWE